MKIMHLSDLHIGRKLHKSNLIEDQKHMLNEIVKYIKENSINVLLIVGDVYDKSNPSTEAVTLLNDFLTKAVKRTEAKIILIAGNHDSPDKIEFASEILKDGGLHIYGNISERINKITLDDKYGKVNFYPIPYLEASQCRRVFDDENIKTQDDGYKKLLEEIKKEIDINQRNICIVHGYITGTKSLETSESERPTSIGTSEYVNVEYFNDFDYVALGHLHQPQKVKKDTIRYGGSLLKYSFSEANHNKSIPIITLNEKGNTDIDFLEIKPLKDLRVIKGKLKDLVKEEVSKIESREDYIMAELLDKGELLDPMNTLRSVYPNALKIRRAEANKNGESNYSISDNFSKKKPLDILENFYKDILDKEIPEKEYELLEKMLKEAGRLE
jgi:exonuclease SbcD